MQTIKQYELQTPFKIAPFITIPMTKDAQILKVDEIRNNVAAFALVDTSIDENVMRSFVLAASGVDLSAINGTLEFLNTVKLNNGTLVLHVFELTTKTVEDENTGLSEADEQTTAEND